MAPPANARLPAMNRKSREKAGQPSDQQHQPQGQTDESGKSLFGTRANEDEPQRTPRAAASWQGGGGAWKDCGERGSRRL